MICSILDGGRMRVYDTVQPYRATAATVVSPLDGKKCPSVMHACRKAAGKQEQLEKRELGM